MLLRDHYTKSLYKVVRLVLSTYGSNLNNNNDEVLSNSRSIKRQKWIRRILVFSNVTSEHCDQRKHKSTSSRYESYKRKLICVSYAVRRIGPYWRPSHWTSISTSKEASLHNCTRRDIIISPYIRGINYQRQ